MDRIEKYYSSEMVQYRLGKEKENVHQIIIDMIGNDIKILDVGCQNGYLGKILKDKGNNVFGIEVATTAAKEARKVLDQVITGNIETMKLPWPDKTFDIIICADVLEHLFDAHNVLSSLKRLLKGNGKLIVSVPNIANYWIRKELLFGRFIYQQRGILDRGHLRFFTYDTFTELSKQCGYGVELYDVRVELPAILFYPGKIFRIVPIIAKKYFYKLFGYQFVFLLRPNP